MRNRRLIIINRPLTKMMTAVNSELLRKCSWRPGEKKCQCYARRQRHGPRGCAPLHFGDDYERSASISISSPRNRRATWIFALSFRALGKVILQVIDRRRKIPRLPPTLWACSCKRATRRAANQFSIAHRLDSLTSRSRDHGEHSELAWYLISQHPEVEQICLTSSPL